MKKAAPKEGKIVAAAGSASAVGGIISAHNVCHTICLGVVAVLSVFGIAVSSTALMWLQDYNLIFWGMGAMFLGISLLLLAKFGPCISKKLILFNAGLLLVGFPFAPFGFELAFWIAGAVVVATSIATWLNVKFELGIRWLNV